MEVNSKVEEYVVKQKRKGNIQYKGELKSYSLFVIVKGWYSV